MSPDPKGDEFKPLQEAPDEDFVFFVLPEQFKFGDPDFNARVQDRYLKNNPAIPRYRGDPTHLFRIPESVWKINLPTFYDVACGLDKTFIPNFIPGMPDSSFGLGYLKDNTVLTAPHFPEEVKIAPVQHRGSPSIAQSLTSLTPQAAIAHWREAYRDISGIMPRGINRRRDPYRLGKFRREIKALEAARPSR